MSDENQESVDRMVAATVGINRHNWSIDLGTDPGCMAFTLAGISNRVVASNLSDPLLRQLKRLGK